MPEEPETIDDDVADAAGALMQEAGETLEERREDQHDLLQAVAEEDGAPLLETKCEIYGHVVPVSGRLTGAFIERVEELDAEAKRRANADSDDDAAGRGVSDIVAELADILDDLIDDPELTGEDLYVQYQQEGVGPIRTILDEVMDSLEREQERVEGTAKGFRSKPGGS